MAQLSGQRHGEPAPNKGRKYLAEPQTPADATAIIAQCSHRALTGIRNRALLTRHAIRLTETKSS